MPPSPKSTYTKSAQLSAENEILVRQQRCRLWIFVCQRGFMVKSCNPLWSEPSTSTSVCQENHAPIKLPKKHMRYTVGGTQMLIFNNLN